MRIGIIAEGHADVAVVKNVLKALTGIEMSDMQSIRPAETIDETDKAQLMFSNWRLVLDSCGDDELLESFFEMLDDEALLVIQIDTAERGEVGYDVPIPQRTGHPNWKEYSKTLRANVKSKIENLIPTHLRSKIAYAIAIEETDAWIIPLIIDQKKGDSSSHATAKEKLRSLVGNMKKKSKYVDTDQNNLNYVNLGSLLCKNLDKARAGNESLNLFCLEVEEKM